MTGDDLLRLCRKVRLGTEKWLGRAKAGSLPAVPYQRGGLRGIGGTRLGVLWTPERVDDAFKFVGVDGNHRLLHESPQVVRWLDWTGQLASEGVEWADELPAVLPSEAYADFEAFRLSGTQYDLYRLFDDPDTPAFKACAEAFARILRKSDPLTEPNRSTVFPSSGTTYSVELIATGPFWSIDISGFESLKLDRLTGFFPAIFRHDWDYPPAPSAQVPRCVSQWVKVPFKCCLC